MPTIRRKERITARNMKNTEIRDVGEVDSLSRMNALSSRFLSIKPSKLFGSFESLLQQRDALSALGG
jgi:hypothetical protein